MESCPLVTEYTTTTGVKPEVLDRLFALRLHNPEVDPPLPFKWPSRLRTTHRTTGEPIVLREYQKAAIYHLVYMPRFLLGDAVGLGKTIDCIAAACYIKDRHPDLKVIVLTTKSTTYQWRDEFSDFSEMPAVVMKDNFSGLKSYAARYAQLEAFLASDKVDVMVCKYTSMVGKRRKAKSEWDEHGNPTVPGQPEQVSQEIREFCKILKPHRERILLICDEGHKFMHYNQTRKLVMNLAKHGANSAWTLTATAIKNRLDEMYCIASAFGIRPLGYVGDFREKFCITRRITIGGGRKMDLIVGYKNVPEFKTQLRPFFLGRSQKQVSEPLPALETKYHPIDLDAEQTDLLLNRIPSGEFPLPPRYVEVADEFGNMTEFEKQRDPENKMTMLSVYQLVANHPCLLDPGSEELYTKELSPKEEALLDMLDGEFEGEKVIVYTKYRTWIDRLERITKEKNFTARKFLRITGAESEKRRNESKRLFQDPKSGYDLIFLNAAGIEGLNLQQAAHMICLDLPWSWGDLMQLVGRMVRMASPHSLCTLHVMVAKGSVDEYTVETLRGKKGLFEAILGQSFSAGLLDDRAVFDLTSSMDKVGTDEEFRALLRAHAKKHSLTKYVSGERLTKASQDEEYDLSFARKRVS